MMDRSETGGERPSALVKPSAPPRGLSDLVICMVGPHYPRPGGVSTQVEALTNGLRSDGVTVHSVDTNIRFLRQFGKAGRLLIPPAQLLIVPLRLWRVAGRADIIHAQLGSHWGFYLPMIVATLVGWLRRRPIVASWHGGRAPVFVPANQSSVMFFLKRLDALIVSSAFTGQLFESLGLHPVAIPNVVELEHYLPNPPGNGSERLAHPDKPALLWIKSMDDAGDPTMMVRAFARLHQDLPGATLTMIGDGFLRQEAESMAQELGAPIAFPGRVSFSALRESYARADIFVIASAFDNQPCTLIEASACGMPVVATATGGIPDMVQDGVDAILTPPGNIEALADAVLQVAQNPELASRLGRAAIESAQKYTWPEIRARLSELYLQIVDREKHG